jgi:hypothetical protein
LMPKPSELFIGLTEFFAVLLPGAIVALLLWPLVGDSIVPGIMPRPTGDAERWVLQLLAAYVIGNGVFHLGSFLDRPYDRVKQRRLKAARGRIARDRAIPDTDVQTPRVQREGDHELVTNAAAQVEATALRRTMLTPAQFDAMNTYKWARSMLVASMPGGAADVHRLEADSKFFRSAIIVCLLAAVILAVRSHWLAAAFVAATAVPCFAIYFDRRLKSTSQAYLHVITLLQSAAQRPPGRPSGRDDDRET